MSLDRSFTGTAAIPWHADAVAERSDRPRAGCVEGRQPAAAQDNASGRLAVAHPSATIGAGALVSSAASWHERQSRAEAADRRPRPQAVRRPVETHQGRHRHRGSGHENLRLIEGRAKVPLRHPPGPDRPRPIRVGDRWIAWPSKRQCEEWSPPPEPSPPKAESRCSRTARDDRM
jgi:hypothetical protein